MSIDPLALAYMFFVSLLCGTLLEILWECLGIFGCALRYRRRGSITSKGDSTAGLILVFIKDILFFTTAGLLISVLIYWANDGQFRILSPVGVFVGFYLCYRTLGRILRRMNEQLIKLLFLALSVLLYPLKKLYLFVKTLLLRATGYARIIRMKRLTVRAIKDAKIIRIQGKL